MAKPLNIGSSAPAWAGLRPPPRYAEVGITVTVYEQAQQFTRLGAGIQIGCNAMKVLRKLGLEQRMRGGSFYPRSWNNRDWKSGDVKFDMIFGESAEEKFGAPYLLAHRGDLHAALASAVPDECVRLEPQAPPDWMRSPMASGSTFANGTAEVADAVVGADGVHSIVRDILFGQSPVEFHRAHRLPQRRIRRRCFRANGSTIAPNGGARTATSSSITSSDPVKLDRHQPAQPNSQIESWSAKGDVRDLRKA